MAIIQPENFNKKKYKRFFAFGCSFTTYHWPTWANILHFELPDSQYHNFGRAGAGNFFIYAQIVAANQKYKFTKDDLVTVLWSTHGREDRFINNAWVTPGNLWTQSVYDENYVKNYCDIKGLLVRDLALFQGAKIMFQHFECDVLNMYSVPIDYDNKYFDEDSDPTELFRLYSDTIADMTKTLHDSSSDGHGGWVSGHWYIYPGLTNNNHPEHYFGDYHPNPKGYLKFLINKGFNISEQTKKDVEKYCEELFALNHRDLIAEWGKGIYAIRHPGYVYNDYGVVLKPLQNSSGKFPI